MNVELVSITEEPEALIAYIARVSNPDNQSNPSYAKLIAFLIRNEHWSPFQHGFMTVRIETSRAIAAQLIRHRSFSFQEFSQRYSEVTAFEPIELRKQATKNRQSSLEVFNPMIENGVDANTMIDCAFEIVLAAYTKLLSAGVAKETARMILPLTTQTTLYMSGSIRSWIHYIALRTKEDTQKEHREIALAIKKIFDDRLPNVASALQLVDKENSDKELLYKLLKSGELSTQDGVLNI